MLIAHENIYCGIFDSSIARKNISKSDKRTVGCFELEFFNASCGVSYINNAKYLRRKSINVFTFVPGISMDSVKTSDRVEYYIAFEAADGTELYTMHTAGDDYIHGGEENATHKKIIDRKWGPKFDAVLQNAQQQESYWSPTTTWFKEILWAD